ncbi:MAG: zinc ABC transporter substrate-binding protein [Pseudomonadota bacterium]|nr:zinc ABC transporter substrate-binding protein [Pseudomonadota bacterium]
MTPARIATFMLALYLAAPAQAGVDVVATIKPLHSIAASVMAGIAEPRLLVSGTSSPHSFALKPSDAAALKTAQVIVWIGPELETALERVIGNLSDPDALMTVMDLEGLRLLEAREGGLWGGHDHGHQSHGVAGQSGGTRTTAQRREEHDPHVWLDPENAGVIAGALAIRLAKLDGANAARYLSNAAAFKERLKALDGELATVLSPLHDKPYVVYHDAYRYFEHRYGLQPAGAITVSPDRQPGARRVAEIRRTIADREAACVFSEPQFEPKLQKRLLEGTSARAGILDPLGAGLPAGQDLYFSLMRGLANALTACLGR